MSLLIIYSKTHAKHMSAIKKENLLTKTKSVYTTLFEQ